MKTKLLVFTLISSILIPNIVAYAEEGTEPPINVEQLEKKASEGDFDSQNTLAWHYIKDSTDSEIQKKGIELLMKGVEQKHADSLNDIAYLLLSKANIYFGDKPIDQNFKAVVELLNIEGDPLERALELYRDASMLGNGQASWMLGVLYWHGKGVQQDIPLSIKWLEKGLEQKHAQTAILLGRIYQEGLPGKKDIDRAIEYYKQAEKLGDTVAYGLLADIYWRAIEKDQDINQTIYWVKKGVEKNDPFCLYFQGSMHAYGIGLKWDNDQAIKCLTQSANDGYDMALSELGNIYLGLTGGEQDLKKAFCWYNQAAQKGLAESQRNLGIMYLKGEGVEQDIDQAISWFQKASDQGDVPSLTYLGVTLLDNAKKEEDISQGVQAICIAAQKGHSPAQTQLAILQREGKHLPKNPYKAYRSAISAAAVNNPHAQYLLSQLYESGEGVAINKERASYWKKQAESNGWHPGAKPPFNNSPFISHLLSSASQGDAQSQLEIGKTYVFSDRYDSSYNRGMYWLTLAANQNNAEAMTLLARLYLQCYGVKKNASKGIELLHQAVALDYPQAHGFLAEQYDLGENIPQDNQKGLDIATKGDQLKDNISQNYIAGLYLTKQDMTNTTSWLEKAATNGNAGAQCQIGKYYLTRNNDDITVYWLTLSADQQNIEALGFLGIHYCIKGTTQEDKERGLAYLQIAEEEKEPTAIYNTGAIYEAGNHFIEQDISKAYEYYQKAAELGQKDAIEKLKTIKANH